MVTDVNVESPDLNRGFNDPRGRSTMRNAHADDARQRAPPTDGTPDMMRVRDARPAAAA